MPVTQGTKRILDIPKWELLSPLASGADGIGAGKQFIVSDHVVQSALWLSSASVIYHYFPEYDGYVEIPTSSSSVFTGQTAGCSAPWSTGATISAGSLTATSGTTSTIVTNQTLAKNLAGWPIHILSGPNAGVTLTISSTTVGANATITVPTQGSAFSSSTVYRLGTPRWYVVFGGTTVGFRVYDYATNTWTVLSTTGLPSSWNATGEASLVATPSWLGSGHVQFATGTATSATSTTLVNSAKTWATNQWTNYQVRIVSGTGAGQIRTIASNDGTSVTVAAWTVTPDDTSVYSIEGNDDFLYLMGNGAVTLYRYQISTNSWSTLTPGVARGGAPGAGSSGSWVSRSTNSDWKNESSIINGRRIYAFRGGSATTLDMYDIPSNAWTNALAYSPAQKTISAPFFYALIEDKIFFMTSSSTSVVRWQELNLVKMENRALPNPPITGQTISATTTVTGNNAFPVIFRDDAGNSIPFVYSAYPTTSSSPMMRYMVF